ncbi:MAG TPA: isoprenylcysteine carboxylmethyltransferase family protein [Acidobacteriaceae bacterium]|nr:isoprenylcysteine carboxylmethyltransferase family protein [Acidobacteriaceae bacterium]
MKRSKATLLTVVFIIVVPGVVVGLVPWLISGWQIAPARWDPAALRVAGVLLLCTGVAAALDAMRRFAWEGLGTPAPPLPPESLVVTGLYRYVRNPMYVSILLILIGQGLLFASPGLFVYAGCAWLATHLFVCFYEEPRLRRTFGAQYTDYCAHVRRWIPRLTPWHAKQPAAQ